jgi:hypothetical protein
VAAVTAQPGAALAHAIFRNKAFWLGRLRSGLRLGRLYSGLRLGRLYSGLRGWRLGG